jgi:hypothetical protein
MKLYATVTSERASKGQGGNDFLEVELRAFDRETPVGHITIDTDTDSTGKLNQYIIKWFPDGIDGDSDNYTDPVILKEGHKDEGEIQCLREGQTKGERQKGDQCNCVGCEKPSCGRYLDGQPLCNEHAAKADGY